MHLLSPLFSPYLSTSISSDALEKRTSPHRRAEIESVGFQSADYEELAAKYDPEKLAYGTNTVDGEEIYFIPNPALGLWIDRERFEA